MSWLENDPEEGWALLAIFTVDPSLQLGLQYVATVTVMGLAIVIMITLSCLTM